MCMITADDFHDDNVAMINYHTKNNQCCEWEVPYQGLKRGLVVSKRLIEVYIWLVVKCVNMITAS